MKIYFILDVKFRAFGMTFGTLHKEGFVPTIISVPVPIEPHTVVDERGVKLVIGAK